MNRFRVKTEVCFGSNAIDALLQYRDVNAVIVTDPFMASSGNAELVAGKLCNCKKVSIFSEVKPDPPIELIATGLEFLLKEDADIVVALGGGSSIDAAKGIVLMARRANPEKKIRLIAIPTTSGTGSEVTKFAVITDAEKGIKYPLVDEELLPNLAILEPSFVVSAPPAVTSDTGFDAITHAIEAYISTAANDVTDALAEKALKLAFEYLPQAYADGQNITAREKMHTASCLAGMAFSEAGIGINHSIAHQLGAKFHIPHGRANAMLLPYVLEYNADIENNFGKEDTVAAKKLASVAREIGLPADTTRIGVQSLLDHLRYMLKMTHTPASLAQCKVSKEEYEKNKEAMITAALNDVCTTTNPRKPSREDIADILSNMAVW